MTPEEFFAGLYWEMLIAPLQGPLKFRSLLQPLTAVILAVPVTSHDVRGSRPPCWIWPSANSVRRSERISLAWKDLGKVFRDRICNRCHPQTDCLPLDLSRTGPGCCTESGSFAVTAGTWADHSHLGSSKPAKKRKK
jgi:hypothetical protein